MEKVMESYGIWKALKSANPAQATHTHHMYVSGW